MTLLIEDFFSSLFFLLKNLFYIPFLICLVELLVKPSQPSCFESARHFMIGDNKNLSVIFVKIIG